MLKKDIKSITVLFKTMKENKMLTPKNNASFLRTEILLKVAQSFLAGRFASADNIPLEISPDDAQPSRGSIEADRAYVKYCCMAAMGFDPEDSDFATSLKQYGQQAIHRQGPAKSQLSVIKASCAACMSSRYLVSNNCRSCFARPCMVNCPKKVISMTESQALIDQNGCIKCGKCRDVCPYDAIIKVPLPCEDACPVGAISKDENGKEQIDHDKCISCGKCLNSCPFGVIVETSQMVDVLREIHVNQRQVVAMLAPAIVGQFAGSINNLVGALKKLGFTSVVEVAVGADITTQKEAAEFLEKAQNGEQLMTTSCCPAYFRAAKVHIPEIEPYVSHTKTPMHYTAELLKTENPELVTVFLGPCLAKRVEAESDPHVDYVLTFEETGAMLAAAEINVEESAPEEFGLVSCAQGRGFPISGGVAGAVASLIEGKVDYKPLRIDGLTKDTIKQLKRYGTNATSGKICTNPEGCPFNMLEVMCCEGGCVAGPGVVALPKKSAKAIETYTAQGANLREKV